MQNNFDELKKYFDSFGLNIFLSTELKNIPNDLQQYLKNKIINIDDYKSIILIGNGGKSFWKNFKAPLNEENHPIDQFSLNVLDDKFSNDEIEVLYPNNHYIPPLQKLGRFFNLSHPTPLGLDISNEFGVWFAYRLLFLSKESITDNILESNASPCESCELKPCLATCPAGATNTNRIDLKKCADYRLSEKSQCADRCLARLSCPIQTHHQYEMEQINYHMLRLL